MATKIADTPTREAVLVDRYGHAELLLFAWMSSISEQFGRGFSGTIVTAKLTGGGANGSMTFENGVLVSQVAAT